VPRAAGEGDGAGGVRRGDGDLGLGFGDVDGDGAARRCLVGASAGEGGVVAPHAGCGPLLCECGRAARVGGVSSVVVADAVEVVVDGDGLRDGRGAARQGGGEGDGLVDGGGGV